MKKNILKYLFLLNICFTLAILAQDWNENSESGYLIVSKSQQQSPNGISFKPKKVDINSRGKYSYSIPLMTVLGRNGFDFPITLNYSPGVKPFQEGSWVGLGWDCNAGSITRNVVVRMDKFVTRKSSYVFDNYRDTYSLTFPEGSATLYQFQIGSSDNFEFRTEENSGWKIEYDENRKLFIVTVLSGTKYIFQEKLAGLTSNVARIYGVDNTTYLPQPVAVSGETQVEPYMVWLLTAILSHDYVDADPVNGSDYQPYNPLNSSNPGIDNVGNWVAFTYAYDPINMASDSKKWFFDIQTLSPSKEIALQEVTYLNRVVTPNFMAEFTTELIPYSIQQPLSKYEYWVRPSLLGNHGIPSADATDDGDERKRYLKNIKLYSYNGKGVPNTTTLLQTIDLKFFPDDFYDPNEPTNLLSNQLMLKKINWTKPNSTLTDFIEFTYYYRSGSEQDIPIKPTYTFTTMGYSQQLQGRSGYEGWYNGNSNYPNSAPRQGISTDGKFLNLKRINFSSGGYQEFSYESNYYRHDANETGANCGQNTKFYGLGVRVTNQILNDGANTYTYSYSYASQKNDDSFEDAMGKVYVNPIKYYTWQLLNPTNPNLAYLMNQQTSKEVLYSRVIETMPNNSKTYSYFDVRRYDACLDGTNSTNSTDIFNLTLAKRGTLLKKEYYNDSGVKVKSEDFGRSETVDKVYSIDGNPIYMSFKLQNSTITQSTFFAGGNTVTQTLVKYFNDDALLISSEEINSNGVKRKIQFKYPGSYSTSEYSIGFASVLYYMKSYGLKNYVIEKTIFQIAADNINKVINSELHKYEFVNYPVFYAVTFRPTEDLAFDETVPSTFTESYVSGNVFYQDSRYKVSNTNTLADQYGNILESKDANNTYTANFFNYNSSVVVASINNARRSANAVGSQSSYVGFESGLQSNGTDPDEDYWAMYSGQTASTDAHTGNFSWKIPAGNPVYGPTRDFLPPDLSTQKKTYVLSCWVKTEVGFGINKGILHLQTKVDGSDNSVYPNVTGAVKTITFGDTYGKWKYIEVEIDIAAVRTLGSIPDNVLLRLSAFPYNTDPSKFFLVDDIRFFPKDAIVNSNTFNRQFQLTSSSNANCISEYYDYDGLDRKIRTIGGDNKILIDENYYTSREGNSNYSSTDPNNITQTKFVNGNFVRNWSFEGNKIEINKVPDNWIGSGQRNDIVKDGFIGSKSLKVYYLGSTNSSVSQYIGLLKSGKTYTASVWFKATSGVVARIFFGDVSIYNGDPAYNNSVEVQSTGDGAWKRMSVSRTMSADDQMHVYVYGGVSGSPDGQTILYDGVIVEESSTASLPSISTEYLNGLNGVIQSHSRINSTEIIAANTYDNMFQKNRIYSNYVLDFGTANHTFDNSYHSNSKIYYTNNGINLNENPYLEKVYETVPFKRLSKIGHESDIFKINNGHDIQYTYHGNTSTEVTGYSTANTLYKTNTTNEQGQLSSRFYDYFGNIISEIIDSIGLSLKTLYEYDALGNKTKSTPPKGASYATTYSYNTLSQLTSKMSPDVGTIQYLYDKNGNLRFIKDANHQSGGEPNQLVESFFIEGDNSTIHTGDFTLQLPGKLNIHLFPLDLYSDEVLTVKIKKGNVVLLSKTTNYWDYVSGSIILPKGDYSYEAIITGSYYGQFNYNIICESGYEFVYKKYDALNRIIEEGEYESSSPTNFIQSNADNPSFPSSSTLVSTKMFYDSPSTSPYATGQRNLKGRLSYSLAYRLGGICDESYYSYDDLGRVEWVVKYQHGYYQKKLVYEYDLQGSLTKRGYVDPITNRNMFTFFEYDQAGRLSKVYVGANTNGTGKTLEAQYTYTASGKVKQQILGNSLQTVDFAYNERDWLTKINDVHSVGADKFALQLHYYDNETGIGAANQYNGNISWISYNTPNYPFTPAGGSSTTKLANQFSYDGVNRLTNANFKWFGWDPIVEDNIWRETSSFDENYSYDQNGNFNSLNRNLSTGTASNISYSYQSNTNKLTNATGGTYQYDANGNVTYDSYRNVAFVIYDINNLPVTVYKTNGQVQVYSYDATGARVRKYAIGGGTDTYYMIGPDGKTEIVQKGVYNNNYTYNMYGNDNFAHINVTSSQANKFYYLKDHLGNNRVTVNSSGTNVGYDDFSPFGMTLDGRSATSSSDARLKFTGKERDGYETGYDYFGARYYDSRIGRWMAVDPLSSKYPSVSPYNYVDNNPLNNKDIGGLFPIGIHAKVISEARGISYLQSYVTQFVIDIFGSPISSLHFDSYNNFSEINGVIESVGGFNNLNDHTIGDFYSHSNYVNLWYDYNGSNNTVMPLFSDLDYESDFGKIVKANLQTTVFPEQFYPKEGKIRGHYYGDKFRSKDHPGDEQKDKILYNLALDAYSRQMNQKVQGESKEKSNNQVMKSSQDTWDFIWSPANP